MAEGTSIAKTMVGVALGGCLFVAICIGGCVVILGIGATAVKRENKKTDLSSPHATPVAKVTEPVNEDSILIEPHRLMESYVKNEVAADEKFKGKLVRMGGYVQKIGKDITKTMYVTFAPDEESQTFFTVQCMFSGAHAGKIAKLRPGQLVVIVGRCSGKFGNVIVRDCEIAE